MRSLCALVTVVAAACSTSPAAAPFPLENEAAENEAATSTAATTPPRPAPAAAGDPRRWIPGDLHMHLAPFDVREGAPLAVGDLARRGRAAGLEFVIATPHLWPSTLRDVGRRRAWMRRWSAMATEARAQAGFTVIPGLEWTVSGHGHYGVSGLDPTAVRGDDLLADARALGGFVVVNHPYALPTQIPGVPISDRDLSYRPWTERGHADESALVDGVEVWNQPLGLANLVSRPGGATGEERAFVAADRLARATGRPVAVVGGTDSHTTRMAVTTWVLAVDASEAAILAALRAGATCVGAIDGGTLVAHGDADPADRWARIGEQVRAAAAVELRWTGMARLFVDGVDRGLHDGGYVDREAAGRHTYRIEVGASRCGFVYANLAA